MRKFRHISLVIVLLALALNIAPAQTTQANDERDFGDAPDSYGTSLPNGARHWHGSLYLGSAWDSETNGQPSLGADGDDNDGTDDEDGVTLPPSLMPGDPAANVTVVVGGSGSGYLDAWIDFNGNGVFDHPAEHLWGGVSQTGVTPGTYPLPFTVPGDAVSGLTYARFRLDEERAPSLMLPDSDSHLGPKGEGYQGEVEDYLVKIIMPVGGHTETVSPLALLWPWLLLAAMVATGAIVAVTLKRRMA